MKMWCLCFTARQRLWWVHCCFMFQLSRSCCLVFFFSKTNLGQPPSTTYTSHTTPSQLQMQPPWMNSMKKILERQTLKESPLLALQTEEGLSLTLWGHLVWKAILFKLVLLPKRTGLINSHCIHEESMRLVTFYFFAVNSTIRFPRILPNCRTTCHFFSHSTLLWIPLLFCNLPLNTSSSARAEACGLKLGRHDIYF